MALEITDKLLNAIGSKDLSSRAISFAWIFTAQNDWRFLDINLKSNNSKDLLADYINNNNLGKKIQYILQTQIIPDQYLNWLTNSHRQSPWIETFMNANHNYNGYHLNQHSSLPIESTLKIPHHLIERDRSIAIFDYWSSITNIELEKKINFCHSMQIAWNKHTKFDNIFNWLDVGDKENKREFFWNWLKSKNKFTHLEQSKFQNHEEILIFFDHLYINEFEREHLSNGAKKAWNQQNRRNNSNEKKQCNFILSNKTILKLEKLSKKYGLTRTAIIEIIIESESTNEYHISERMRRMDALTSPLE